MQCMAPFCPHSSILQARNTPATMVSASVSLSTVVVATVLSISPSVDAHGVLARPGPAFTGTAYGGDYSAVVPMSAMPPLAPEKYSYGTSWADIFGRAFKKSKYSSFKEFILKNQDMSKGRKKNPPTAECGFTAPDKQKPQALPDKLEWYGGQQNHPGPCEAWCDNELVLPFTPNCQAAYPDGKFPYNKSKCVGKKRLSFYWMATLMEWQVYIQCINIGGSRSMDDDDSVVPSSYNFTSIDQA